MAESSPKYHHGSLRTALLEEAAKLIEVDGVEALTLRELARRLDVSHAAPGHHFADKAALLGELAAEGFEELADGLEASARRARAPVARLREVGRAYVRFALERPGHYRIMFGRGLHKCASARLAAAGSRAYGALESAVASVLPEGRARSPERVREAAFVAWSGTHGAAMLLLDGPTLSGVPTSARSTVVQALVDHLTATLATAIAEKP